MTENNELSESSAFTAPHIHSFSYYLHHADDFLILFQMFCTKAQKCLAFFSTNRYNILCADVAQLAEQLIRNQQVAGSIPAISLFICGYSLVVEHQLPKLNMRVRFPLPAPYKIRRKPFGFTPLLVFGKPSSCPFRDVFNLFCYLGRQGSLVEYKGNYFPLYCRHFVTCVTSVSIKVSIFYEYSQETVLHLC